MLLQGNNYEFSAAVVFRHKAQSEGKGHSLYKGCNTVAGHHSNALWVGLSAPMDCVAPLGKGGSKLRLAMNADRPTEFAIITLKEH